MLRDASQQLLTWKNSRDRKPLLLQGARQVGKTYLLKAFGAEHFPKLHVLNFEDTRLHTLFEHGPVDIESALLRIQTQLGTEIDRERDVLFFDEIQDYPVAIHALKYFNENTPELAIMCAGSHIGISGSEHPFPVGKVHFETLYPLSFGEFLHHYKPLLRKSLLLAVENVQLDEFVHQKLWEVYLLYSIVGGMPEAVVAFLDNKDVYAGLISARDVHRALIKGYINDFSKYTTKAMAHRIRSVFQSIPGQLQAVHDKSTQRYKFKGIVSNYTKYAQLQEPIDWLVISGLVLKTPVIDTPRVPLDAYKKPNLFKLMMLDVGLLNTQLDMDLKTVFDQSKASYKGFVAENFVLQQLFTGAPKNYFSWTNGRNEIEFVFSHNSEVIPIEVKSSSRTRSKSLSEYKKKFSPTLAVKLSAQNLRLEDSSTSEPKTHFHLNAPLYMAEYIGEMCETVLD